MIRNISHQGADRMQHVQFKREYSLPVLYEKAFGVFSWVFLLQLPMDKYPNVQQGL